MFSKLRVCLLVFISIGSSISAAESGFKPIIHQVVLSREVYVIALDETDFQVSELHNALAEDEDCSRFDVNSTYSSYELSIEPQEINTSNASAFGNWFEGKETFVEVKRVVFQTCRGIY